jgi:hypothetical protein
LQHSTLGLQHAPVPPGGAPVRLESAVTIFWHRVQYRMIHGVFPECGTGPYSPVYMLLHAGGRITVDNEHNHALYGPTASPTMVRSLRVRTVLCCPYHDGPLQGARSGHSQMTSPSRNEPCGISFLCRRMRTRQRQRRADCQHSIVAARSSVRRKACNRPSIGKQGVTRCTGHDTSVHVAPADPGDGGDPKAAGGLQGRVPGAEPHHRCRGVGPAQVQRLREALAPAEGAIGFASRYTNTVCDGRRCTAVTCRGTAVRRA